MQVGELGEFELIERLLVQLGKAGGSVLIGAGDDAAAVGPTPGMVLLATCDTQVEGRHFVRSTISPEQLGSRLAAVNLSDIAAMGGMPRWALVSLMLPPDLEPAFLESLYRGLAAQLQRFGACVIGGNVAASTELALDLTLLGEAPPQQVLRRGGARAGDAILVTGSLGGSAAGRAALERGLGSPAAQIVIAAHLTPEPRVGAGRAIAASGLARAMIDVSDGFAQDLGHICDASGAGASIDAAAIPISPATLEVARELELDPLQLALTGGEDYELICIAPAESVSSLTDAVQRADGLELTKVGTIVPGSEGRWLLRADGRRVPLGTGGWQHFGGD